jgi:hypothetical protein
MTLTKLKSGISLAKISQFANAFLQTISVLGPGIRLLIYTNTYRRFAQGDGEIVKETNRFDEHGGLSWISYTGKT